MTAPITWGGLDFDTAEMDRDMVALLSRLAPEGGSLRALPLTARCSAAADAAREDGVLLHVDRAAREGGDIEHDTAQDIAIRHAHTALSWLADAQAALFEAHEAYTRALRALES